MSIFPILASVTKRLDAIREKNLWQGSEDKKKYHLVKWEELVKSKRGGGLNIRELNTHKKELNDEVVMEVCIPRRRFMEGGDQIEVWHAG